MINASPNIIAILYTPEPRPQPLFCDADQTLFRAQLGDIPKDNTYASTTKPKRMANTS
jgi:hypothetical protein